MNQYYICSPTLEKETSFLKDQLIFAQIGYYWFSIRIAALYSTGCKVSLALVTDKHTDTILRLQTWPAALAPTSVSNALNERAPDAQEVSGSLPAFSHLWMKPVSYILDKYLWKSAEEQRDLFLRAVRLFCRFSWGRKGRVKNIYNKLNALIFLCCSQWCKKDCFFNMFYK